MSNVIHFPKSYSISAYDQKSLKKQAISEQSPGTVLHDFDTILRLIGSEGVNVCARKLFFPPEFVVRANSEMANPITIGLKSHAQRLYPHINALYLLLRASGLAQIRTVGGQKKLMINPDVYDSWEELNPCEKYFTLLETWLIRANSSLIGEERGGMFAEPLFKWDSLCKNMTQKGLTVADNTENSESIRFFVGMYVVAMLEMFGFITVKHGKSEPGKGWQIEKIQKTSFGAAMLNLMLDTMLPKEDDSDDMADFLSQIMESEDEPAKELKDYLRPFFPEWQHSLKYPEHQFKDGVYVFKVALNKDIWRKIAIPAKLSLHDLSIAILNAYHFDQDHLYVFIYQNSFGDEIRFCHPYTQDDEIPADEVQIGELTLHVGDHIGFRYDFGDDWRFTLTLESIEPAKSRLKKTQLIESEGNAPDQYAYYEE